jgi:hypothetical protein
LSDVAQLFSLDTRGFEVYLVNARHTKNLPGRKSDVQESQWLLKLHTYSLTAGCHHVAEEPDVWDITMDSAIYGR